MVIKMFYISVGTHWVAQIMLMLLQGTTEPRKLKGYVLENIPNLGFLDTRESPRILTSHLPYRWLPKNHLETGGKIVHAQRNPKDVYVSLYHFLKTVVMPGTTFFSNIKDMTWDQFFNNLVASEGNIMLVLN